MVVLEGDAGVDGETIQVVQFVDARDDVVLDCLGQSHIVSRENQFHGRMMVPTREEIQPKQIADF